MNNVPGYPAEEEVDSAEGRQVEGLARGQELVEGLTAAMEK